MHAAIRVSGSVMFDALSTRLQDVFRSIRGEGRLTEANVESALREIRLALLEADVNFKVVKAFIDRVRDRAMDQEVLRSLTPAQQVVRIVRDEMLALFGDAQGRPAADATVAARGDAARAAGLGQDDDGGKLGRWLTRQGRHPLLVSTDVRRPAAIQQLNVLGQAGAAPRARSGRRDWIRSGARRGALARGAATLGFDVADRRHGGPAAHRRCADGGARGDQGGRRAGRICSTSPTR